MKKSKYSHLYDEIKKLGFECSTLRRKELGFFGEYRISIYKGPRLLLQYGYKGNEKECIEDILAEVRFLKEYFDGYTLDDETKERI